MRTLVASVLMVVIGTCACTAGGAPAPRSPGPLGTLAPATSPTPSMRSSAPSSPIATSRPAASAVSPPPSPPSPGQRATSAPIACLDNREQNAFVAALLDELHVRDRSAIEARMAKRFEFRVEATDVALEAVAPAVAVSRLYTGVPDPDGNPWFLPLAERATVRCVRAVDLADLGADSGFWPGWDIGVLSSGWGEDGRHEAILVLGHRTDGSPVWRGLFYSPAAFELRGS